MVHFEELTPDQAWWLEQAQIAVRQTNQPLEQISWMAQTHNAVFRAKNDFVTCVLMLQRRDDAALLRLVAQGLLMKALLGTAQIVLPPVLDFVLTRDVQGMLTLHLDGETRTPETLRPDEAQTVGEYLARLHNLQLELGSAGAVRPVLDADGLFGERGIYFPGEINMGIFTGAQLLTMNETAAKVRAAMETLGRGEDEYGLIHADLLLHNILFHEGEVRALDWEYSGWGYYLYDLTPLLWQMKPYANYDDIQAALWHGYTAIRPLRQQHRELLETFIAGRQVASMRWVAANQHNPAYTGKAEAILARRTAELQDFLTTGILNRRL